MKDQDTNKLWQQINAELEQNQDVEVDQYLKDKGINSHFIHSINKQAKNLIESTFVEDELINKQLHSKYKIIQQIDSGGQSDVYLAERSDGVYEQTLVIKYMAHRFNQNTLTQQFYREMQLLADLRHPGVVTIIDGNITQEGRPWLVLEYINGPHIDHYCSQQQLSTIQLVGLMMNLCETLQFIHQRKVLHKDLKPSNVLVKKINDVPFPVLIDFGIAIQDGDQSELTVGTQGYSAPEQIAGEAVDQRTDLFSLGVLFGQLLLADKQLNLVSAEKLKLALIRESRDQDLVKIVAKLTATDASMRYQNADSLRSDLSLWQLGFPLSFDNHKFSKVMVKSIRRHPWTALGLVLVFMLTVFFTVKYTQDIQTLQQITIVEKNATDELMNFMLDDLYQNLERIGRIDVLKSVADKSVAHLSKQDPLTIDTVGHFQAAKAYMNTGRVFDYLEQTEEAKRMYQSAESHLNQPFADGYDEAAYYQQLALLRVYQSQVSSSEGQEQATKEFLQEAISSMQRVLVADPGYDQLVLWEANLELSYHLMEYAKDQAAKKQINQTILISNQQLNKQPKSAEWLFASSQSHQMKAWYEFDFGDLQTGLDDVEQAIQFADLSIMHDGDDLKKLNNERILFNQLAYFQLENDQIQAAEQAVLKALEIGEELKGKAPFNREFEREYAISFSTAGEIYQLESQLEVALEYFLKGLEISEKNHAQDPLNYSTANDLAVDSLLVADLLQKTARQTEAHEVFVKVDQLMSPVHAAEKNNKYYAQTLLVAKLQLQDFEAAKVLFELTKKNEMIDGVIEALLIEHGLEWELD